MHCRSCAAEMAGSAEYCPSCGASPLGGGQYCPSCGNATQPEQELCVRCGARLRHLAQLTPVAPSPVLNATSGLPGAAPKNKGTYIVLALLPLFCCGIGGVHNLYAGRIGIGLCQLAYSFATYLVCCAAGVFAPLCLLAFPMGLALFVWQVIEVFMATSGSLRAGDGSAMV